MKIVNKGTPTNKELKAEWLCGDCRSTIESTPKEGKIHYRLNKEESCVTFVCPVCHYKNTIRLKRFK